LALLAVEIGRSWGRVDRIYRINTIEREIDPSGAAHEQG